MTAITIAVTTIAEIAMKAAEKLEAISRDERPDAKRTQTMFWAKTQFKNSFRNLVADSFQVRYNEAGGHQLPCGWGPHVF